MTVTRDQIYNLEAKASTLPYGAAKVALFEEAVQLADSLQDIELAYSARENLMDAACFSGRPDAMLVAFTWCISQYDRDPERFNHHDILWKYKWIIEHGCEFPEIARSRLEGLLRDMERRYREAGSSMHAVWLVRRTLMQDFGDLEQARLAHAEYRRRSRDSLSDCAACSASADCKYYSWRRQWSRAVQAAQPVLQKRLRCAEEPHRTIGRVLRPLFHRRLVDEANSYQRQGYRLIRGESHFVGEQADHLRFLVLVGDVAQAKRLLERHLSGALAAVSPYKRFQFFLAARLWADRIAAHGLSRVKVKLPQQVAALDADGNLDSAAICEWLTSQLKEIARRFDKRNGTNMYQQQIEELPRLLRLAAD